VFASFPGPIFPALYLFQTTLDYYVFPLQRTGIHLVEIYKPRVTILDPSVTRVSPDDIYFNAVKKLTAKMLKIL
jgi:hypothetical protein